MNRTPLLGAHVSTAGGIRNAPTRAAEIGATAIQIFTKMPNRWAEKPIDPEEAVAFVAGCRAAGVEYACAHDSYLINLATPDPVLRDRSFDSFKLELLRARDLNLQAVVTHPGNATDGNRNRGIEQNAALIAGAIQETGFGPMVLLETTAGAGHALGSTFEELAMIRNVVPEPFRDRIGVCLDTCHVFCAGYDLVSAYDAVMDEFDRHIGLEHLRLFHLNDSQRPLASKHDRHAGIGEGMIGDAAFRRLMRDPRFAKVPKVIETPKGDDPPGMDRQNLERLRSYAEMLDTRNLGG